MPFKFEKLEVWQLALEYVDLIYAIADKMPRSEEYNLKSQAIRAATSIALNIAEGSIGQTDVEQARFVGMAIRSAVETVACQNLINHRQYLNDSDMLREAYRQAEVLVGKLHALRKALDPNQRWMRDEVVEYMADSSPA